MDTGYLAQQVATIISQLHTLFDEIGVPSHERDVRDSEVSLVIFRQRQDVADAWTALRITIKDTTEPRSARRQVSRKDI